jgi:hypothetical protein
MFSPLEPAQLAPLTIISQSAAGQSQFAIKQNGGDVSRPRAADDFPAIRARMEELRRERARVPADDNLRRAEGLRPHSGSSRPATADKPELSLPLRRVFFKLRIR